MRNKPGGYLRKSVLNRENSQYKRPEVGPCAHLEEISKETSVALDCVEPEKSSKMKHRIMKGNKNNTPSVQHLCPAQVFKGTLEWSIDHLRLI